MIKICIEGWRKINHSYALVNQRQLIELNKYPLDLSHKDLEYYNRNWNEKLNFNGFTKEENLILENIRSPEDQEFFDVVYRISFPFNFEKSNSKKLFVFGTSEYQNIDGLYLKCDIQNINKNDNLKIITPSNWSKKGFLRSGFKPTNIFVLPNGVETKSFYKIDDNQKIQIRKKINLKESDFILSSIGAMTKNKGIEQLIIAFSILKKKYSNLKLILKDQSNLYNLKSNKILIDLKKTKYSKILNDDVLKDIILISQNLPINMLNELYNITDCYVSPYLAEGFNLTPLEAAATGTPIIVTKGGSTDDYYDDSIGLQIESKTVNENNNTFLKPSLDSLIDCISDMILKKKTYNPQNIAQYVNINYNWKLITQKLLKTFEGKI